MSFLTSVRASINPHLALRQTYIATTSAFHTSTFRPSLKESDRNRDNMGHFYEAEKINQMKARKEGKAKWSPDLATNSEADVKADRGEVDEKDFKDLQERTKNAGR